MIFAADSVPAIFAITQERFIIFTSNRAKIFIGGIVFAGKVPAVLSLSVTLGLIIGGILYSLWRMRSDIKKSVEP